MLLEVAAETVDGFLQLLGRAVHLGFRQAELYNHTDRVASAITGRTCP